ncbi:hypothetical protein IQ06DRAFT_297299 [Phaeosphaeriaceae sp. SRC1lsM3a]|nr:hypothetical protein IQ06DRAFT_297299 [Stagonospora sp. SRC1lsM3a]
MSSPEVMLQALFGVFVVLGIVAGLHYRESLICICIHFLRYRDYRVEHRFPLLLHLTWI